MIKVAVFSPHSADKWAEALASHLPSAKIHLWPGCPDCDYAAVWKPPPDFFVEQNKLKAVFAFGAGVDSLACMDAIPKGVPLIKIEDGGMGTQMIEYALYVSLHYLRRFEKYAQAQKSVSWNPLPIISRRDVTIGILGLGSLGSQVAEELAAFGFTVFGWSRTQKKLKGVDCRKGEGALEEVLKKSNVLLVLLPMTKETSGLLNMRHLSMLPRDSCLANLSRGALLVEQDLLKLLDSGHISRAFLDVFQTEPLPPEHPFWRHHLITMTPHIAAQTPYEPATAQIAEKILKLENGESVTGVVDRNLGY